MIEILIPTFVPQIKNARKVSFKSKEDLRDEEIAKTEADAKREAYRQSVIYRMRLHRWKKKWEAQAKKVRKLKEQLRLANRHLEAIESEKPLQAVSGTKGGDLLEPLHVVTKKEIPSFTQSRN